MASRVAAVVLGPWSFRRRCRWQRWAARAWTSLGVTVYWGLRIAPSRVDLVTQVILGRGLVFGIPAISPIRAHQSLLSLVELKSERDLAIFRTIYAHSVRIGDNAPGWEITYATEF